jgi:hypothetical protein
MATDVPTKQQLIDMLRSTGQDAAKSLRAVPAASYETGRYENGWNARQILAHIAAIEWTYARLIDLAVAAANPAPAPPDAQPAASESKPAGESRPMRGGVDDYNARQVEKRADASVADLIAELEKNRAQTIAAVERADEALLQTPIRSAGGISGPLAAVVRAVAIEHVMGHVADITGDP